jgi:alkylhydroperoxidase family enzyme
MALVPYLVPAQIDPEHRHLLERPIHLFRALANSPEAFVNFHRLAEWIRWDCTLDPRLRELLILQVGYSTADEYEWSHHVILSRQFGVTEDDIQGLIDFTEGRPTTLSAVDQAVVRAAAELTHQRRVSDATWAALGEHFDHGRLTDIVLIASFYNMVVRVLGGLRIEIEPDWAEPLLRFPLREGPPPN